MDDQLIPILLLTALPIFLISAGAVWMLMRRNAGSEASTLAADAAGSVAVPVRELLCQGGFPFFVKTRNSLKPRLSIEPGGIRFRVIQESYWPFSEIERIDARKSLFGAQLVFKNGAERYTLTASVRDLEIARQVLAVLPSGLTLTAAAASLRNTSVGATV